MQNIGGKFLKHKLDNEKNDIYTEIENAQMRKTDLLLNLGMIAYEKIRKSIIIDESFDNICDEILEIDKLIYNNKLKIKTLEESSKELVCECGNILNSENNFCPSCGKKIEVEEEYFIECARCNALNEDDSIYCGCCGIKL